MEKITQERIIHQISYFNNLTHRMHPKCPRRGQRRVLKLIAENNGRTQKELVELAKIRPASLSELLNKLARDNLIERRQNEDDKRCFNIYITEAGQNDVNNQEKFYIDETIFLTLSEAEGIQLSMLLAKLIDQLELKEQVISCNADTAGTTCARHQRKRCHCRNSCKGCAQVTEFI